MNRDLKILNTLGKILKDNTEYLDLLTEDEVSNLKQDIIDNVCDAISSHRYYRNSPYNSADKN